MEDIQGNLFSDNFNLEAINFTELNTYMRCKLEYKYRFNPRNQNYDPKGKDIYIGRFYHNIISEYLSHEVSIRKEYLNNKILYEKWQKYEQYYRNDFFNSEILKTINMLKRSYLSVCNVFACEYSFNRPYDHYLLKGRVDCIIKSEFGDIIIDFKLNENEFEHLTSNIQKYLQLIIYYYGIRETINLNNVKLAHYFFNTGKIEMIDGTDNFLSEGWEVFKKIIIKRSNETSFKPSKNAFCNNCNIKLNSKCPLF